VNTRFRIRVTLVEEARMMVWNGVRAGRPHKFLAFVLSGKPTVVFNIK
jgi:hypothetical protein